MVEGWSQDEDKDSSRVEVAWLAWVPEGRERSGGQGIPLA